MIRWIKDGLASLALLALISTSALASQATCVMPTSGTVSGLTLVNTINGCNNSLISMWSGASAPATPQAGQLWFNTNINYVQQYDGADWLSLWYVDAGNNLITAQIGGGISTAVIASSGTTDLGSVPQAFKTISGVTTITSFGSSARVGSVHILKFAGVLSLTYNATSMILPGAAAITTQAGDVATIFYLGAGNWQVVAYSRADGTSLPGKVVTASIADANVTYAKIQNVGASRLLGNTTGSPAAPAEVPLGAGMSFSGGSLVSTLDPAVVPGYLSGVTLSTAGASSTFAIAAGVANDRNAGGLMTVPPGGFTKNTNAWVFGSGGALDTSTIAINTWYYVFVIKRPDTGVVDACITLSASACATAGAPIPAAYTLQRRIGAIRTNASSQWVKFFQFDNRFIWDAPFIIAASTYPTGAGRNSVALTIPTGITVTALFTIIYNGAGSGNGAYITSLLASDSATLLNIQAGTGGYAAQDFERLSSNGSFGLRPSINTDLYTVGTRGWEDTRGQ